MGQSKTRFGSWPWLHPYGGQIRLFETVYCCKHSSIYTHTYFYFVVLSFNYLIYFDLFTVCLGLDILKDDLHSDKLMWPTATLHCESLEPIQDSVKVAVRTLNSLIEYDSVQGGTYGSVAVRTCSVLSVDRVM